MTFAAAFMSFASALLVLCVQRVAKRAFLLTVAAADIRIARVRVAIAVFAIARSRGVVVVTVGIAVGICVFVGAHLRTAFRSTRARATWWWRWRRAPAVTAMSLAASHLAAFSAGVVALVNTLFHFLPMVLVFPATTTLVR